LILSGEAPEEVCPVLYGASLVALKKKDGGIRPIASGVTYRRIAAKVACATINTEVGASLRPQQMGFGTPCGAEALVHATTGFLFIDQPGLLLKLDFRNAFNTVNRSRVLECARDRTPHLFPAILQAYGSPSLLFFGDHQIDSEEGLQQGDPLAPALFCLAIDKLVKSLQSPLNAWFLDDGGLGGPGNLVHSDLQKVIAASEELGLILNGEKCELRVIGNCAPNYIEDICRLLPGIKILNAPDCELLGAPLTLEALPRALTSKIKAVKLLVGRLDTLQSHVALFLLKNCLATPKLVYLLRCSPTWREAALLQELESIIRSGLEPLFNVEINGQTYIYSFLPLAKED
jgi:hypothetical protein